MVKIILRAIIILLVAGLVAGGIYLFAAHGGMSLASAAGQATGLAQGEGQGGFPPAGALAQPGGAGFAQGQPHFDGGRDGQAGFSLAGLSGVAAQAGKIAAITAFVVAVQAVLRMFQRRRKMANAARWQKITT